MAQKKFRPPTELGSRFKPPQEVTGRTAASFVTGRCIGSVNTQFGGSEALMTDGRIYWLKVCGFPSSAAKVLTDATDRFYSGEELLLDPELAPDWCRAHGVTFR